MNRVLVAIALASCGVALVVSSRAISTRNGSRKFKLGVLRYELGEVDGLKARRRLTLQWDSRAPKHGRRSARAR